MTWTADFLAWPRSWITPKRPQTKPAKSLAELETEFARAVRMHQPRSHIEKAMQAIRNAGLRTECRR